MHKEVILLFVLAVVFTKNIYINYIKDGISYYYASDIIGQKQRFNDNHYILQV